MARLIGMSGGRSHSASNRVMDAAYHNADPRSPNEVLATVARHGFCQLPNTQGTLDKTVSFLRRRGFAVTNTHLRVKPKSASRPGTLSAKYGTSGFPFHTDFAFSAIPPRFILLSNETSDWSERTTLITPIERLEPSSRSLVRNSTWRLLRSPRSYLVSGCFTQGGQVIWRWDCDFLEPANEAAEEASRLVPRGLVSLAEAVDWQPRSAVLIDNWACTHARDDVETCLDETRVLTRYEFWRYARMVR